MAGRWTRSTFVPAKAKDEYFTADEESFHGKSRNSRERKTARLQVNPLLVAPGLPAPQQIVVDPLVAKSRPEPLPPERGRQHRRAGQVASVRRPDRALRSRTESDGAYYLIDGGRRLKAARRSTQGAVPASLRRRRVRSPEDALRLAIHAI